MFARSLVFSAIAICGSTAQMLMINTPASLIECQPSALSFSGGTAPYYLSVLPGGQSTAAPLEQFPVQSTSGTYTWTVDLPAGTSVTLQVRDGTGALNYASPLTIIAGTSTSCLNTNAGAIAATASTAAGVAGTSTATVPPTAQATPSGLYGFSESGIPALPASASFSQLGSAVFNVPLSYQVVESGTGVSGAYSATGTLINGPSNFVYSVAASGAASRLAEYASCSISGSRAVCAYSAAGARETTFTAPYATAAPVRRRLRLARDE